MTRSTARPAGWQWRIPLRHRLGNGYVFSSAYQAEDSAAQLLLANLDGAAIGSPRLLKFTTGRRRKAWSRNCVAIGLATGFVEPLESTSIHLIESGIGTLIELFPAHGFTPLLEDEYNRILRRQFESVRDFIILHYCLAQGDGGAFWRDRRAAALPDTLMEQIELFAARGQVSVRDQGSFAEASWVSIYLGNRRIPRRHDPIADLIDDGALRTALDKRRHLIDEAARSMPHHTDFLATIAAAGSA